MHIQMCLYVSVHVHTSCILNKLAIWRMKTFVCVCVCGANMQKNIIICLGKFSYGIKGYSNAWE